MKGSVFSTVVPQTVNLEVTIKAGRSSVRVGSIPLPVTARPRRKKRRKDHTLETAKRRLDEQARRERIVADFNALIASGTSRKRAARALGVPIVTLWRYLKPGGTRDLRGNTGRPPAYIPTEGEIALVRSLLRGQDRTARIAAYRAAAASQAPEISDRTREFVRQRGSRLPDAWLKLLEPNLTQTTIA
jgi:hypothetical protein